MSSGDHSDTNPPGLLQSGPPRTWLPSLANTAELEAANVQMEAAKARLKATARKKDTALGLNTSTMSLEVPLSSSVVQEPAPVHAAQLA